MTAAEETGPEPIRVLLADDLILFRRAIAQLIGGEHDLEVVGQASNGLLAAEAALRLRPDVVVLDVEMPVMNGIEAARRILAELPDTHVIMLTVSEDDEHLLEAVRLGVHGYLLKDLDPDELFDMIRAAMRNENPVSPALVGRLLAAVRSGTPAPRPTRPDPDEPALSLRELDVLRLVADGLSNKEIGVRLSITEGTVKNHVHNALAKLNMDNRIQAATYVVRNGIGLKRPR